MTGKWNPPETLPRNIDPIIVLVGPDDGTCEVDVGVDECGFIFCGDGSSLLTVPVLGWRLP